jgi:hypothetical protein
MARSLKQRLAVVREDDFAAKRIHLSMLVHQSSESARAIGGIGRDHAAQLRVNLPPARFLGRVADATQVLEIAVPAQIVTIIQWRKAWGAYEVLPGTLRVSLPIRTTYLTKVSQYFVVGRAGRVLVRLGFAGSDR